MQNINPCRKLTEKAGRAESLLIYAGIGQTLKVVLFDRLHFWGCRSHAAQLRADAKAGRNMAEK